MKQSKRQAVKRGLVLLLALLCLAGCGKAPAGSLPPAATAAPTASPSPTPWPTPDASGLPPLESADELAELTPADFGCFETEWPTRHLDYTLLTGTDLELPVHRLEGGEPGPLIYIVGGLHGDELAGWYAGELLKQVGIKAGTVVIAAPANRYGAANDQRRTQDEWDLNRVFPGDPEGVPAQRIAAALYGDILEKAPALVLDLHEAYYHTNGRDNLGNGLICRDISPVGDLVFHLLEKSQDGSLTARPLDLFGSPPAGSLNDTLMDLQGIPVLTIETLRTEPLPVRVRSHLRLAEEVFLWYDMG